MAMIFIPGMRPGLVSGAVSSVRSARRPAESLAFGPSYRGKRTPRNLVPYEEPRTDTGRQSRVAKAERARDVADAYDLQKHQPNTAREKLRATRAAAAEVEV